MANSADPDQLESKLIWIYAVCKGRIYLGSAGLGLTGFLSGTYYIYSEYSNTSTWADIVDSDPTALNPCPAE